MFVCYWGHEGARSPSSNTIHWPYNVSSTRNRSIVFISWFSWRLFGLIQSWFFIHIYHECWVILFFKLRFSAYMPWNVPLLCVYDLVFTNGFIELSCEISPSFTVSSMVFFSRKVTILYSCVLEKAIIWMSLLVMGRPRTYIYIQVRETGDDQP